MIATSTQDTLPLMPTVWYCVCSFVANAGVAITGYGMALIFVTVYTVGELSGGFDYDGCSEQDQDINLCGIKYAVFLQSLSLVGSMPMLLFAADAFRNSNPALLATLIPITLIATPFGQYCQTKISASWIKVVVGAVVVIVVLYKIILDVLAAARQRRRREHHEEQQEKLASTTNGTEANETTTLLEKGSTTPAAITPDNTTDGNDDSRDHYYHGFSVVRIRLWGILLGGSSGFLGGLIGMRGPPLMIFFLAFPFPKSETRAVGAIMLCLNMILRIGYYIVSDVLVAGLVSQNDNVDTDSHDIIAKNGGHHRWFFREEWVLYVGVIVSGTVAIFIGDWVHHKLDQNTFQRALALLLVATGIVNIWKGTSELHSGQGD